MLRRLFISMVLTLTLLLSGCVPANKGELLFIEPGSDDLFHYPYFLFVPNGTEQARKIYVIVEPNNSGFVDDDFQKHIDKARRTATLDFYLGNYVARKLGCPLLVPVFPRPESDWKIYTHALDRDVMQLAEGPLKRIDLQLIAMFDDAREILKEKEMLTNDDFLLTGFSASGTFANRFTLLHPDNVHAVFAGGVNGMLIFPVDSLQGMELNYPFGTSDFRIITGKEFQPDLFKATPQFYFMGELDSNDTAPYSDAFDDAEREIIYNVLGEKMQPDRWDFCEQMYIEQDVHAVIKTYPGIGHEHPQKVKEDMVDFFRSKIDGR